ncbi:MAG: NTP transferase domain-containing protein, partial [Acidobacteria bacterium]|nr:NTP transferase domain-containing protein [Acidobacteriota bacterium]
HLLGLYSPYVQRVVLVLNPEHERIVTRHLENMRFRVNVALQPAPTGMLDAIRLADAVVRRARPGRVWITWCDQIAVHPVTVARLVDLSEAGPDAALVFPTVERRDPYIHLVRNDAGEIVRILHRREGDTMPEVGESDSGLFALSSVAFFDLLPSFAGEVREGSTTGERNFLPFIPWLAGRAVVRTFPCVDEVEAIGVNTPEELRIVERCLLARQTPDAGTQQRSRP